MITHVLWVITPSLAIPIAGEGAHQTRWSGGLRWLYWVRALLTLLIVLGSMAQPTYGQPSLATVQSDTRGVHLTHAWGQTWIEIVAANVIRVRHLKPTQQPFDTELLNEKRSQASMAFTSITKGEQLIVRTAQLVVNVDRRTLDVTTQNRDGLTLLHERTPYAQVDETVWEHAANNFYGGQAYNNAQKPFAGQLRNHGASVDAGYQGSSGGPWLFTRRFGVLVDSASGEFVADAGTLRFAHSSKPYKDYFVIVGSPITLMQALADLTGPAPMLPKWTLGFIHSEWGMNQREAEATVAGYRQRNIPLDALALDFDFKAWGEDNAGEFRWNSSSNLGNVQPNLFPDGAAGGFAQRMQAQGVKLMGIMKPRIIMETPSGSPTQQGAAITRLGCVYPQQEPYREYFSKRLAQDVDFAKSVCRDWYWQQAQPLLKTGIVGWWNDEADIGDETFRFANLQGKYMAQTMYEGQRRSGDQRVFTLNRNFALGAQQYAYGLWSGDIAASFASMADQRTRMLSSINTGSTYWGMDTGGFLGHPSPELYARWIQFAAFVPLFRVHGVLNEQRQPWVYGRQAESVATEVIRLRYRLMPYWYAAMRQWHERGLPMVRPLFYDFPDDARLINNNDSWMVGRDLLVAPVVEEGQQTQAIYLPAGEWIDFYTGQRFAGNGVITRTVDAQGWRDLPLFVRQGGIVSMQSPQNYVGQFPLSRIELQAYPDQDESEFVYYDDDGETYAYERGVYFRQAMRVRRDVARNEVVWEFDPRTGNANLPLREYLLILPSVAAQRVMLDGKPLPELQISVHPSWLVNGDGTTHIVIPAGVAAQVRVVLRNTDAKPQPASADLTLGHPMALQHNNAIVDMGGLIKANRIEWNHSMFTATPVLSASLDGVNWSLVKSLRSDVLARYLGVADWPPAQQAFSQGVQVYGTMLPAHGVMPASCLRKRTITIERWDDIGPGKTLDDLTQQPTFPAQPTQTITDVITLQIPQTDGKNYGARMQTTICPPFTGVYTFWIAGDNQAALALDGQRIAFVPDWAYYQEWDKYAEQKSAAVFLQAGQIYALEVLHKADGTSDHVEVAWAGPQFTRRMINIE